ncbi:hypothetical protein BJ170DRAFT_626816 [Xylariales sp. AK1849]|nr:hypothetical protein BJ170DRAFT_626816 [Xylariales sp. AK1849]
MASPTSSKPSDNEAVVVPSERIDTPPKAGDGEDIEEGAGRGVSHAQEVDGSASPSSTNSQESGEASPVASEQPKSAETPPLPNEPPPAAAGEDDGWDFHWDEAQQAYFFHNRITGASTWDNPRLPSASTAVPTATAPGVAEPPKNERPPAGGYNPAIHGDYDPNAWYAQSNDETTAQQGQPTDPSAAYAAIGSFNRFTGRWQGESQDLDQHNDENKSRRQMNAFFDVDAAANSHDGRSLKAERSGKKPSKDELKQFKEKRRAKKEEKRRAWLMD